MRLMIIATMAALLLATYPGRAKTQFGPGAVTCGTYLDSVRKDPAAGQGYRDWIAGFLSGFNETLPGPDALKDGQQDSYFKAVEDKCKAMPDQPLSEAIINLEIELRNKLAD